MPELLYSVTSNAAYSKCWFVQERHQLREHRERAAGIRILGTKTREDELETNSGIDWETVTYLFGCRLLGPRTHLPALTLQPPHTLLPPLEREREKRAEGELVKCEVMFEWNFPFNIFHRNHAENARGTLLNNVVREY